MEIINEKIEILAEVQLGTDITLKYCHIRYKNDAGGRYPVIIIERGDSLNRTTETTFVIEKDFKKFVKNIYLRLDEIEVAEKENSLLEIRDGIFLKKGCDW
jgi:hypothetical protein